MTFKDFWISLTVSKNKIEKIKEDIVSFTEGRQMDIDTEISHLTQKFIRERLDTLPLNMIVEMGRYLDIYNQSKDKLDEMTLIAYISLSYSYEGWFRKKLVSLK